MSPLNCFIGGGGVAFLRISPSQDKRFSLCDFGSAGGTFVRLASEVPTPLYPGMMIMLGKHQVGAAFLYCVCLLRFPSLFNGSR